MVGITVLRISTASAGGRVIKFMTKHARGTEEDRAWLAEGWIRSNSNGRDHVQDAEWVGRGYLSCCGWAAVFPVVPLLGTGHFWRGSEVLQGSEHPFPRGAGALQGMLAASEATAAHRSLMA